VDQDLAYRDSPYHIGIELRDARTARGLSYEDVAKATKIKPEYLRAIENLAKSELPSIGYVLGFIRTYANFLGMDGGSAVARYKVDSEVPENLGLRDRPHFVPKRKIRLPRGFYPAITVMAIAGMLTVWYGTQTATQAAAVQTPDLRIEPAEQLATQTAIDPDLITVKALAPSWVQVKDETGRVIITRIFVTDETWQVPNNSGMVLSARDGGALELHLGETNLGPIGETGVAFSDMPLTVESR